MVNNSAAHDAPTPNSAALTSNTWANPVALAVPALITPIDPIDISAASRETALLIADARLLRSVGADASMTDIRGVMVATEPTVQHGDAGNQVGDRCGYPDWLSRRISSRPIPAKAGPAIRKRGAQVAATRPT